MNRVCERKVAIIFLFTPQFQVPYDIFLFPIHKCTYDPEKHLIFLQCTEHQTLRAHYISIQAKNLEKIQDQSSSILAYYFLERLSGKKRQKKELFERNSHICIEYQCLDLFF